jgi:glycerol-3-phosphate dehydrogenase (NAD(P)+)
MLTAPENPVRLWCRSPEAATYINAHHRNPRYLPDFDLPESILATGSLEEALDGAELVIIAIPSQSLRPVMAKAAPFIAPGAILCSTVKGIEYETGMTMHQLLEDVLPEEHHPRIVSLSGPSFAREVAERRATVVTVACREEAYAISVQATLSCPWFRCYSTTDVMGVEIGGALKNVIAIAVGIADGKDGSLNTRAALMTRGLAEMARLADKLGADPATLHGLSGMGDLVLTCTGDLSRNRRVGLALGRGQKLEEIIEELGEVAEGVRTTQAACRLAGRIGVELPIAEMVRQVIDGELTPDEAGSHLMNRQLRSERDTDR